MSQETPEIHHHLTANAHVKKRDIMINNFLGGLSWGIGTVIGASVVVAIIGAFLRSIGVFDAIGGLFEQLPQVNKF